jgi:RimJ/RimL family protein N-acetyltransferase
MVRKGRGTVQGRVARFTLPDGEEAVIHELRAPLGAGAEALLSFWSTWDSAAMRGPRAQDSSGRLLAREDLGDRWYVATTLEGIVCALELSRSNRIPHLGSLHHLLTAPARREQGLARHVLDEAMDRFVTDGGQAIVAQTVAGSPACALLESCGFVSYLAMPGQQNRITLRRVFGDSATFEAHYFAPVAGEMLARRPLRRSDKAALLHLFSGPVPYLIRHHALQMYGAYGFEESVALLLDALDRGQGASVLGVTAGGSPAALGTVLPADLPESQHPYRRHVRVLDLFALPGQEAALAPVLEALLVRADVLPGVRTLLCTVDAANTAVCAVLEEAGFTRSGMLHDVVALGQERADAVLFELTRGDPPAGADSGAAGEGV